jgi:hypothetical protein
MHSDLADALRRQIEGLLPFVAPVLVYPLAGPGVENWITGGTALLASTEQNRFLLTAEHFVREIDILRTRGEIVVLLGGTSSAPIEISHWPILARDDFIDICTIQVPTEFEADELNKSFFDLDKWPPNLAKKGDQAIILGFPAAHRQGHEKMINTRVLPISDFVTDVGPRRFTIADENEEREILINPDNLVFPTHLGGMSGSPVFRTADNTRPELLGVFSEGSDGLRGAYFCSHAQFLLPNGQLDFTRIPPR